MRPHATVPSILTLHLLWMAALLSTLTILLLTGCGAGRLIPPSAQTGASIHGVVHGGQQPVANAHVYLFAANTTGYGGAGIASSTSNASIDLLQYVDLGYSDATGVYALTAADGSFDITGDYTCTPGQQVYLYVHGGNPGGGTNSAAGFLTILGSCPAAGNLDAIPYVEVNEVSTVAAAYAFAAFASDPTHVSTNGSPQALTGIANAFATATNLVDLGSGTALTTTPAGNGTVPTQTINTLANILASCVNTANPTEPTVSGSPQPLAAYPHQVTYSSQCNNLRSAISTGNPELFSGHVYDTATAAIFIAQNPGANIAALYALPVPKPPFSPALTSQPNDFTLGIQYTGEGLDYPYSIAVDASGNVWFGNYYGSSLVELSPLGAPLSPTSTGFTGGDLGRAYGLAIDTSGNVWAANYNSNSISEFSNTGTPISTSSGYTGSGLDYPLLAAFNTSGNLWVANYDALVISQFNSSGTPESSLSGGGLDYPMAVAFDASGSLWAVNYNSTLSKFNSSGIPLSTSSGFTGGGLYFSYTIAVDSSGNIWTANYDGNSLSEFNNSGTAVSPSSGFTGGGLNHPGSIAIDGAGNIWAANYYTQGVSEFSNSGTPITNSNGYYGADAVLYPWVIAVDSAGNVWTSADGPYATEIIGAAIPVEAPTVQALKDNCIAQRPCLPPD